MNAIYPFPVLVRETNGWKDRTEFPPNSGKFIIHPGLDYGTADLKGDDRRVLAMYSGGIVRQVTEWGNSGSLGWGVQVFYPDQNVMKLSLHLASVIVKVGQKLTAGQMLAVTGKGVHQTIVEHTHEQYELGDHLSTGLMGKYTQNPYNYVKDAILFSQNQPAIYWQRKYQEQLLVNAGLTTNNKKLQDKIDAAIKLLS